MTAPLTKDKIEQFAPDQAWLGAALKLMKPTSWPMLARNDDSALLWGECQGSGAAPYRVIEQMHLPEPEVSLTGPSFEAGQHQRRRQRADDPRQAMVTAQGMGQRLSKRSEAKGKEVKNRVTLRPKFKPRKCRLLVRCCRKRFWGDL
jgi:hypothetical protein